MLAWNTHYCKLKKRYSAGLCVPSDNSSESQVGMRVCVGGGGNCLKADIVPGKVDSREAGHWLPPG